MGALPCFAWPYGLTNDPSFALIAENLSPDSDEGLYRCSVGDVVSLYAAMAENAARENCDGWFAIDLAAVAFRLGIGAELGREILEALIDRGRIERDTKTGGYFFTAWELDHAMPPADPAKEPATPLRLTHRKTEPANVAAPIPATAA